MRILSSLLTALSGALTALAWSLIVISVIAFFVLASFVPIGGGCFGISLLAFVTPLCGESNIPQSAYFFVAGGGVAGVILLGTASSVKGFAIVLTVVVVVAVGLVYVAASSDRTFPGSDRIRAAVGSPTNPSNSRGPKPQHTEEYIAQAVAATVVAQQATATPIVIRPSATPTMSRVVTSIMTEPVRTSATPLIYTPAPEPTARPTVTPTRRPTFTPRPTLTPTPQPTPTPAWRPPTAQELAELKQLMLELTNVERAKHGAPPVKLGNNPSPQIHAEHGLENCYSSHWDLWGLKPLYRYALTGGDQYTAENGSGINYCPKASDNYRVNWPRYWEDEVRETVAGWMGSPGHRRNLLDPRHTVLHVGITIGKYGNSNMVQVFSGDYVSWTDLPGISNGMLTAAGRMRGALYDGHNKYGLASIEYHPPTQMLTPGQLAGTYCLESDIQVGSLSRPLEPGWYYTDRETGRQYTDYTTYTNDNRQCVNPYELPADRPAPASWDAANAQHYAAVASSSAMLDEESLAYSIVSERLDISSDGREFSIRANLSPILSHYGPGIYTITIWATTPDGKPNPVAQYPIWWHTEPTLGHPY